MNITVVRLHHKSVVSVLEDVLQIAREGKLKSLVLAGKLNNGEVVSGWGDADLVHRQELISHMQIDVVLGVFEKNME